MIIENDQDYVKVTILLERPTNSFQDDLLVETLGELSEVIMIYEENYQEYL